MSEDGKEPLPAASVAAYWVTGASTEQREAHYQAQRWSHVLPRQIDRLYEARRQAMESHQKVLNDHFYPDEARWPFMMMDAEAHFVLVAARQLLRALRAFDGNDRLPVGLTNAQVRYTRDALEHWDATGGSQAAKWLVDRGGDPTSHMWSEAGPGVLGKLVPDAVLRSWAMDVYVELERWDPYDGWRTR